MIDRDHMVAALPAYEIGGEIGRGACGVVFAAHHRRLNREVAIKQLPRAFGADPAVQDRFVTEAQLLASFDHPHIVEIYDYVEHDGLCLLVMERLTGGSLADRHHEQRLRHPEGVAVALAAASALECAHSQHVLHRDMKPENLMFSRRGTLKVTDFGIAKVIAGSGANLTQPGLVLGTPAYMAPEQAEGTALTPATDVYALAVVLFELLAGSLPFKEERDPLAVLYQRVHHDPAKLADVAPAVPSAVAAVIDKALSKDPRARFARAEEFGAELARAASTAWGARWLDHAGIEVHATGRIAATITRTAETPAQASPEVVGAGLSTTDETSAPDPVTTRRAATVASPRVEADAPPAARRRRWPVLVGGGVAGLIAAVLAVLVLAGGSGKDAPAENASSEQPTITAATVPPPPAAAPPPALPTAEGPLEPGTYRSALEPSVAFTLGPGWEKLKETPRSLTLGRLDRHDQFIHLLWVAEVADPAPELVAAADLERHVVAAPQSAQLANWLRVHPRLAAQDGAPLAAPKLRGSVVDFTARDPYRFEACSRPCVVLFPHLEDNAAAAVYEGDHNRAAVFPVTETALVALVRTGPAGREAFDAEAAAVLSSLTLVTGNAS